MTAGLRIARLLAAVCVIVGATHSGAQAATISSINLVLPPNTTGSFGPSGTPPAPNNDEAGATNPNVFTISPFFNQPGISDIEFILVNSGGTTEYRMNNNLVNVSSVIWSNFRFELGFGTGANFLRADPLDPLDFDDPSRDPAPFSNRFTSINALSNVIDFTGGQPLAIGTAQFLFAIDVPDDLQNVNPYSLNRFTLRLSPNGVAPAAVPEPASLLLIGTGLLGLAARTRRRISRKS